MKYQFFYAVHQSDLRKINLMGIVRNSSMVQESEAN